MRTIKNYRVVALWINQWGKTKLTKMPEKFKSKDDALDTLCVALDKASSSERMRDLGWMLSNTHIIAE